MGKSRSGARSRACLSGLAPLLRSVHPPFQVGHFHGKDAQGSGRAYTGRAKLVPVVTVLLLLFQIVLGGIVVLTRLHVDLTTFHFANAIVIFMLTLYMVYFDGLSIRPLFNISGYKGLFFALSVLVFIQLVLGAYVRHAGAGLACPDFPTSLGYIVPPRLSGLILYHYSHRTLAYLITALAAVLLVMSFYSQALGKDRGRLYLLAGLIVIQIALGVTVVLSKLHFAATGFHLVIALLILWVPFNIWCRRMQESSV